MALVRLVLRLALRNRARALITALGVGVTMLAFLLLRTLVANWYSVNDDMAESDQFEVRHKISIDFVLYKRMTEKIRTIAGVEQASAMLWFSGYYKDEKARFGQLAVEGDSYFEIFPEYAAAPEQMADYMNDLSGALVGRDLAAKYGWKLGDKITLTGTLYPGNWDLTVRGIYPGEKKGTERSWLFMHYKHVGPRGDHAHRIMVKATPSAAKQIDQLFANTDTPTKTESMLSVKRSWAAWSSSMIAAIDFAGIVILGVLILVLGNALAMASRDATREYAMLRAIGYRSRHIIALVMAEGFVVASIGVILGLVVAPATLKGFSKIMEDRLGGSWQLDLDAQATLLAVASALGASMLAAAWPAWRSGRLQIVQALRQIA